MTLTPYDDNIHVREDAGGTNNSTRPEGSASYMARAWAHQPLSLDKFKC